jgi:glutamate synthase (ferredoxin)
MEHRGGCGADNDSGDGAGLMSGIPWDLLNDWGSKQGLAPFEKSHTGVGMVFLPQDENSAAEAKAGNFSDALKCNSYHAYMDERFLFGNACV